MRPTIDAKIGGTLMNKAENKAYNLIEEMALNNYNGSMREGNQEVWRYVRA